ncbi:MAG: DUF998 domain-containing protein [Candidatus Nanopelagicales bacterium]
MGVRWLRLSSAAVVVGWVLVSVGGAVNPGFKQYEQYLSALSADGTSSPGWGRGALIVVGVGLATLIPVLIPWCRICAGWTAVAALGAIAVALVPMPCPSGERFCATPPTGAWEPVTHAATVTVFTVAVAAALVAGACRLRELTPGRRLTWSAVAAGATLACAPMLLSLSGLPQRLALLAGQLALLAFAHVALSDRVRVERREAGAAARRLPVRL